MALVMRKRNNNVCEEGAAEQSGLFVGMERGEMKVNGGLGRQLSRSEHWLLSQSLILAPTSSGSQLSVSPL